MLILLLSLVVICSFAASTSAQQVEDQVIVTTDNAPLRSLQNSTDTIPKGEIVVVKKVEGDRLIVRYRGGKTGGVEGFINRADVLPLQPALDALTAELKKNPTAAAYVIRGSIWGVKEDDDKARADFDQAIRLNPKNSKAFYYRGLAWFRKGLFDQALSDSSEAIRLDPTFARAYVQRAYVWRAQGKSEKAIADCDEVIRINPSFAPAYTGRAAVWTAKGKYDQTISECNEAIRLDPKFAMAYAGRGHAWQRSGKYDEAIADYDEAIKLEPKLPLTFVNRGTAWDAKGGYDRAFADYKEAIRLSPKFVPALVNRAWLAATCPDTKYRDAKQSLEDAKTACELTGWRDPSPVGALAAAFAEQGDFENAVKWQEKAIDLVPQKQKRQRAALRSTLNLYQAHQPFHQSGGDP
jgi:tetratricopeptide (TPR) repeat protein